jgi:hypothetical protein
MEHLSDRSADHPARSPLYVISTHKVRQVGGTPPHDWIPYGVEHAWTPGSRRTLCGQWTTGWTVFWEQRFSATHHASCPQCVEASLPAAARRRLDPVRAVPV